MRIKCVFATGVLIPIFLMGCAGVSKNLATLQTNSDAEQKVIIQKLKDHIADYHVYQCRALSVFDPKNDDKTIEVSDLACRPFVQQGKLDFVRIYEAVGIRTIVGPEGQVFGYLTYNYQQTVVKAEVLDARTLRISQYRKPEGAPGRR
jgi:hypothetical protein